MDQASDQCFGCGRTRHEIAIWGSITEPERRAIMAELPERLKTLEAKLKSQIEQTPHDASKPMKENF
jgi:predicted Fe-S protein YdhL (DUF1289 family)